MSYLSYSPTYPFIRDGGGLWNMSTDYTLKEMQMEQCIKTIIGSRPMLKHVGCEIARILFVNDIESRNAVLTKFIKDAIEEFVENVIIDQVEATQETGDTDTALGIRFDFEIQYRLGSEKKSFKMPYTI